MVQLVLVFSSSPMYFDSGSLYYVLYILNIIWFWFIFQNTIEGLIAYFPVVGRLECDSSSVEHRGFWEHDGFGLLGIYKSDWIKTGGKWT